MLLKINLCLTFGIFLVLLVVPDVHCQQKLKKTPPCHFRIIDECITPLFYFTHKPESGLVINRREHALLCRSLRNTTQCLTKFFEDCGTQLSKEIFELLNDVYSNKIKTFCRNGEVKNNFLEHARCLHENVQTTNEYKKSCINTFQATLEKVTKNDDTDDKVGAACCGYKYWLSCAMTMATEKCESGENAANALFDYISVLSGGVGEFFCSSRRFDHSSKYCKKFIATSQEKAEGRHSNSVLSKYFSLFFPNLGF